MGAHAKFSASGSDRWLNCPASIALSENAPPQVESVYATEGTTAHTVLEIIMRNRISGKKDQAIAQVLSRRYPPEMIRHGMETANRILELVNPESELLLETRVDLGFVDAGMFGTVDAAIVNLFGLLWVIDYKYGAGRQVDPEDNSQMIYYALGIAKKYDFNFERVRLAIAQPRILHKKGFFRTWDMEVPELMAWENRFQKGVEACKDPFAPVNPGRWCFFCPAQSICPAIEDNAYNQAQADFGAVLTYDDIYLGANETIKQLNKNTLSKGVKTNG